MAFVDKVTVTVAAGNGGDGKLSFRREKFIQKGGPDGGDGGHGGNIILQASRNQNTLAAFRYQKELKAEPGQPGGSRRKHGRSGRDLIVAVPVGTVAANGEARQVADLVEDGQTVVVARGGKGGFGNAHFVSSRRQSPAFAEKGEPGEVTELTLELKMIADVGLVGLPNAGKSTLLAKISNARPEVADYPFTTLTPHLGVVDIDKQTSILVADIPGLIAGAASGKGLGHDFLRHIERTSVILHLIDAYAEDIAAAYQTIKNELKAYQPGLDKRPEIIALTKTEGLDEATIKQLTDSLKAHIGPKTPVLAISAHAGRGLNDLLFYLKQAVTADREKPVNETKAKLPVITLPADNQQWQVKRRQGYYAVSGPKIEQFARRTDFTNDQAVTRLRDIMRRQGILHELRRQGLKAGQIVQIGSEDSQRFNY